MSSSNMYINDVGITGSRYGLTAKQHVAMHVVLHILKSYYMSTRFHHGDCIGVDNQANSIASLLGYETVAHPPSNNSKRAFCKSDTTLPEMSYYARNMAIVDSCQIIIGCPRIKEISSGSGTWSTIKYCRSSDKNLLVLNSYGNPIESIGCVASFIGRHIHSLE